jgi:uncharacterized protein involved in high-affinity Fe2+ transport
MAADLDSVLEDCLDRISQGESLQACLVRYPEQATELEPLLIAAAQFQEIQVRPSASFKSRARAELHAHMDAHPQQDCKVPLYFPIVVDSPVE